MKLSKVPKWVPKLAAAHSKRYSQRIRLTRPCFRELLWSIHVTLLEMTNGSGCPWQCESAHGCHKSRKTWMMIGPTQGLVETLATPPIRRVIIQSRWTHIGSEGLFHPHLQFPCTLAKTCKLFALDGRKMSTASYLSLCGRVHESRR